MEVLKSAEQGPVTGSLSKESLLPHEQPVLAPDKS